MSKLVLSLALLCAPLFAVAATDTDPIHCTSCEAWNRDRAPFKLYGNSYYVGVDGLSSVLIADPTGLILIDAGLPQSAQKIAANIRQLGFRVEDIRWIVNGHAHHDHAGGIAALARMSGARVAASPHGAEALRAGNAMPDDPQWTGGDGMRYPPIERVERIADGEPIKLGDIELQAVHTPGHTPGSSSWTWRSCEDGRCLDLVYADSLTAVSAKGFRFADRPALIADFRRSIARVAALPCDLVVSAHPDFSGLFRRAEEDRLVDSAGCRAYAEGATRWLDKRLQEEAQAGSD